MASQMTSSNALLVSHTQEQSCLTYGKFEATRSAIRTVGQVAIIVITNPLNERRLPGKQFGGSNVGYVGGLSQSRRENKARSKSLSRLNRARHERTWAGAKSRHSIASSAKN